MAQLFLKISLIAYFCFVIHVSSDAFSEILDNTKQCEDKCLKSYAPHTYPNGDDNDSCQRGCRLYTVTSFVTADEPNYPNITDGLSPAKSLCYHSCIEAYNETSSSTNACKVGCDGQEQISLKLKSEKSLVEGSGIHLLKPVMEIREVVSKVFGMLRIVQSSLTTYFLRDDDKLVAIKGPVEVMVQAIPPNEDELDSIQLPAEESQIMQKSIVPEDIFSNGASSIECLSRRVGVPPYLLLISLVGFLVFLGYILFIICTSGNKKKKVKSGIPIPSHALPVKLVRPEDLTKLSLIDEEEGQAPELPQKLKLPENTII